MLIVCNGAAKSGSTWLYNIVSNMVDHKWPDNEYISRSNTKHPTIKEILLEQYLTKENFKTTNILSKNHYGKNWHRELLLSSPDTRIIDMSRDTRDVIVSSYYDYCRRNGFAGTFSDYYWRQGRLQVDSLSRYHDVWSSPHPQIHITSFEALKMNFYAEVEKISEFLNVSLSSNKIDDLYEKTSIKQLRANYSNDEQYNTDKNPFFRKGEIGDWVNHFDSKMIKDYENIKLKGISKFDLVNIHHRFVDKINRLFEK